MDIGLTIGFYNSLCFGCRMCVNFRIQNRTTTIVDSLSEYLYEHLLLDWIGSLPVIFVQIDIVLSKYKKNFFRLNIETRSITKTIIQLLINTLYYTINVISLSKSWPSSYGDGRRILNSDI